MITLEQNVIVLWDSEGTDCCLGRNVFTMITRSLWKHASFQKSHENNFLPLSQTGYLQSKNEWPRMFTIGRIALPIMVIIGRIAKNGYYRKNSYSCRNRNDYTGTKCHSAVGFWGHWLLPWKECFHNDHKLLYWPTSSQGRASETLPIIVGHYMVIIGRIVILVGIGIIGCYRKNSYSCRNSSYKVGYYRKNSYSCRNRMVIIGTVSTEIRGRL